MEEILLFQKHEKNLVVKVYIYYKHNHIFKYLSNFLLLRILPCQIFYLSWCCKSKYVSNPTDIAKVAMKSEKLSPFGGFF